MQIKCGAITLEIVKQDKYDNDSTLHTLCIHTITILFRAIKCNLQLKLACMPTINTVSLYVFFHKIDNDS